MAVKPVTLAQPGSLMKRAAETARAVKRPLEEVLTATFAATLRNLEDVPPEMRVELARMT